MFNSNKSYHYFELSVSRNTLLKIIPHPLFQKLEFGYKIETGTRLKFQSRRKCQSRSISIWIFAAKIERNRLRLRLKDLGVFSDLALRCSSSWLLQRYARADGSKEIYRIRHKSNLLIWVEWLIWSVWFDLFCFETLLKLLKKHTTYTPALLNCTYPREGFTKSVNFRNKTPLEDLYGGG